MPRKSFLAGVTPKVGATFATTRTTTEMTSREPDAVIETVGNTSRRTLRRRRGLPSGFADVNICVSQRRRTVQ
jgi:hypothetical protein